MPASETEDRESQVRAAFAQQARWCEQLGSPFTARLCTVLGERLDRSSAIARRLLEWPWAPDPFRDALTLRLCGGLHALVRRGDAPALAALYPPADVPDEDRLWAALAPVLARQGNALDPWLDRAPQTNEVGRSAVLMAGLLALAARFPYPIRLFELGASAGLNLLLDRYGYDLGGLRAGDPASPVQLRPAWEGPPPPAAKVRIADRGGVDLYPANVVQHRERLIAYVWPDQTQRLRQLEAALAVAAADPPPLDQDDAADWIEGTLALDPQPGVTRVVMHSVAFVYFPAASQARIAGRIEAAGARATGDSPVAWLRFEKLDEDEAYGLRLRTWPGEDRLLAWAHPHGAWVRWLA